jgi:hypothetical protein
MFMLMVPYNVMCGSVSTVLCVVFLFASLPTEFVAANKGNVEQQTPKDTHALGRHLAAVGVVVCIERSVGPVVNTD